MPSYIPNGSGFINASSGSRNINDPKSTLRAKRESFLSLSNEVYHYTTLIGFKGIIEENGFWASGNRYMNDTEENSDGIRILNKVIDYKQKRQKDINFSQILVKLKNSISNKKEQGNLVACFSHSRDDLGQWRAYGNNGICIKLGRPLIDEFDIFYGPDQCLFKIIYNERKKIISLLSTIREFERYYILDRNAATTKWQEEDIDQNYLEYMKSSLSIRILGFKNKSFQNESEARIILSHGESVNYEDGLRFRASPIVIIPYVCTGDNIHTKKFEKKIPIRQVIIGTSENQKIIASSIETFLRHKNFNNTIVTLSNVPHRHTKQ